MQAKVGKSQVAGCIASVGVCAPASSRSHITRISTASNWSVTKSRAYRGSCDARDRLTRPPSEARCASHNSRLVTRLPTAQPPQCRGRNNVDLLLEVRVTWMMPDALRKAAQRRQRKAYVPLGTPNCLLILCLLPVTCTSRSPSSPIVSSTHQGVYTTSSILMSCAHFTQVTPSVLVLISFGDSSRRLNCLSSCILVASSTDEFRDPSSETPGAHERKLPLRVASSTAVGFRLRVLPEEDKLFVTVTPAPYLGTFLIAAVSLAIRSHPRFSPADHTAYVTQGGAHILQHCAIVTLPCKRTPRITNPLCSPVSSSTVYCTAQPQHLRRLCPHHLCPCQPQSAQATASYVTIERHR